MAKKNSHSRAMRQLAEEVVRGLVDAGDVFPSEQQDYITSLVRQWIGYAGHATLFLGDRHVYFHFRQAAQGRLQAVPEPGEVCWLAAAMKAWKISPDQQPEIVGQLNQCQGAVVTNEEGESLEFWVDPKERSRGVRPSVKKEMPADWKRDHHRLAGHVVQRSLGPDLDADELEALTCSVATQWQKYAGHAHLFTGHREARVFLLVELGGGDCKVDTGIVSTRIEAALASHGLAQELIPDVIGRLNLAQEVEFDNQQGIRSVLWYDPKEGAVRVRPRSQVQGLVRRLMPPAFCPRCSAVLKMWRQGDREQKCPQCSHVISIV